MSTLLSGFRAWFRRDRADDEARRIGLRLALVRRCRLLAQGRALFALMEDGREKLSDEYIYDRAYLTSLVGEALERCAMLEFDASVLQPGAELALRRTERRVRQKAQDRFLVPTALERFGGAPADGGEGESFAEERMLVEVVRWLEGDTSVEEPAVRTLIREAFAAVFGASSGGVPERLPRSSLRLELSGGTRSMTMVDLSSKGDRDPEAAGRDVACRPLAVLLLGARSGGEAPPEGVDPTTREAFAVLEEERFHLRCRHDSGELWLVASLCGHAAEDYVFLYAPTALSLSTWLPEGFHLEPLEGGDCAWIYDVPGSVFEASLGALGRAIFRDPAIRG